MESRQLLAADLLADISDSNIAPAPSEGVSIGNVVYFGNTDATGNELWRSDGTVAGTYQVADLNPGTDSSYPSGFLPFENGFVFDAVDETGIESIWYSDGTESGTVKIQQTNLSNAKAAADGTLFFIGDDPTLYTPKLWQAEADMSGTLVVAEVFDIFTNVTSVGSDFETVGDKLFFSADQGDGMELWVSDGVGGSLGTQQVADIRTTINDFGFYGSYPDDFFAANGLLFFTADKEGVGRELWSSDGTLSGTVSVGDINPTSYFDGVYTNYYGSYASDMTESGGFLFFSAIDGSDPTNPLATYLYVTDGSADSATKVSDRTSPTDLTDVNGELFYAANDNAVTGNVGNELWSSTASGSGVTIAGTTTLAENVYADNAPYAYSSYPNGLTEFGGKLIFAADDGISGEQLWALDPVAGTNTPLAVVDPNASFFAFSEDPFIEANGQLFFSTQDNSDGTDDIWKTDGTMAGTVLVEDFSLSGSAGYYPQVAAAIGTDTHLFFRPDATPDWYSTTGTPNSALNLTANFQTGSSSPTEITETSLGVFFVADDRLWLSNGTEAGTVPLDDGANGLTSPRGGFAEVDIAGTPTVFFVAETGGADALWKTDGTAPGTSLVRQFTGFSDLTEITAFGSSVMFRSYASATGSELWISDGTTSGTMIVSDLNTNPLADSTDTFGSYPQDLTVSDGLLYFTADGGGLGRQLYQSNGSTISAVTGAPLGGTTQGLVEFNGQLIFDHDNTVWKADAGVATLLEDFGVNSTFSNPRFFTEHQGELAFVVEGDELWSTTSDGSGTVTGVVLLDDLTADPYDYADAGYLASVGSNLFFAAEDVDADPSEGIELWAFDGTDSAIVLDIQPGDESSYPLGLTEFQGQLIFSADDGVNGRELWTSDGTAAGTVLLNDIHPVVGTGSIFETVFFEFVEFDDQLFFPADNGVVGEEVWTFTFPLIETTTTTEFTIEGFEVYVLGAFRFAETVTSDLGGVVDITGDAWTWEGLFPDGPAFESVTVTATDSDGLTATATFDIVVNNAAPTADIVAPATVPEGSPIVISLTSFDDPGDDTLTGATVIWSDLVQEPFPFLGSTSRTFDDEGTVTADLFLADEDDPLHPVGSVSVIVTNVAPTVDAGADIYVEPISSGVFTANATFTDPGNDTWTGTVDYGDGNPPSAANFDSGKNIALDYPYTTEGIYTVTITIDDGDGGVGTDSLLVEIDLNTPPTASDNTITTLEDTAYVFAEGDFGFTDVPEPFDDLEAVSLTTIPVAGTLFLDVNDNGTFDGGGEVLSAGDVVDISDIDANRFIFLPAVNANGLAYAGFGFEVDDGFEFSTTGNSITIDVTPVNDPPTTTDISRGLLEDTVRAFQADDIPFDDVDGDAFESITLVTVPSPGSLFLDLNGNFIFDDLAETLVAGDVVSAVDLVAERMRYVPEPDENGFDYASFEIRVSDGQDTSAIATVTLDVAPVNDAPTVDANSTTVTVIEGTPAFQSGSVFDIDENDSVTMSASVGTINVNGGSWTWSLPTNDGPADSLTVTITADDGLATTDTTFDLVVSNFVPTFDAGGDETLTPIDGGVFNRIIMFTDPGADTWTGTVDFGDGSGSNPLNIDPVSRSFDLDYTYETEGVFEVSISLDDGDLGTTTETFNVSVSLQTSDAVSVGAIKSGIGVQDNATGSGFILHSVENVFTRFASDPPHPSNAENLIAARYNGTVWQYSDNSVWIDFIPQQSDRLLAIIDFDADSVASLEGATGKVHNVDRGYETGDLSFFANQWNGNANQGEFDVEGTNFEIPASLPLDPRAIGNLKSGVGVQDNATGTGYLMHSVESVFVRFASSAPHPANGENVVAVRYLGGQWQYSDNLTWNDFDPRSTDVLLASVDFDADTVSSLQGAAGEIAGITQGYVSGDLSFFANQWNGNANGGEFDIEGSNFNLDPVEETETVDIGPIKSGVGVQDNATGSGFLMHSRVSLGERFVAALPHPSNAINLIAVRDTGTTWQYNSNSAWIDFVPLTTDRLLASVDFDAGTITSLQGASGEVNGIEQGYLAGDLAFFANQWNGNPNAGEYDVEGTFYEVAPVTPTEFVPVGAIKSGVGVHDNADGSGFLLHSRENVFTRFETASPHPSNANHLIAVRFTGLVWEYSDNGTWISFVPDSTDRLLATIDFSADTIISLEGASGNVNGIEQGYLSGDLRFFANQWNGNANAGEFDVEGTFFEIEFEEIAVASFQASPELLDVDSLREPVLWKDSVDALFGQFGRD